MTELRDQIHNAINSAFFYQEGVPFEDDQGTVEAILRAVDKHVIGEDISEEESQDVNERIYQNGLRIAQRYALWGKK